MTAKEIIYLNGKLLPQAQASIPVTDYGFLYGFGLFETMRAYRGKVFLLEKHLGRISKSAKTIGLSINSIELKKAVAGTVEANHLSDARIRLTVSGGPGQINGDPASCQSPTTLVLARDYKPVTYSKYESGFEAVVASVRRNSLSLLSGLKSTSYLESLIARQEARTNLVDEAVCLNEKGTVAEGSMSNIFIVDRGNIKTPGLNSGILPGITRAYVFELAAKLRIPCFEHDFRPDELYQADEAFFTNSLIEIMPLTRLNGKSIGRGTPGPVTSIIAESYRSAVNRFINSSSAKGY